MDEKVPIIKRDLGSSISTPRSSLKRGAQEEEASDKYALKHLKTWKKLDRQELKRKERGGGQDDGRDEVSAVRIARHVVNEEVMEAEMAEGEWESGGGSDELDPV